MKLALQNAALYPEQVGYVCANALSHRTTDATEARVIRTLFREAYRRLPVSSIRGVMGHPLAPAGIFQTVACALAMRHGLIPPTANLTDPDPACELDHVVGAPRRAAVEIAMVNAHGQRGENTTLLARKAP